MVPRLLRGRETKRSAGWRKKIERPAGPASLLQVER
jgi:hypothetical protein